MKIEFSEIEIGQAVAAPQGRVIRPLPHLSFDMPASMHLQLVGVAAAYLVVMGLAFRGGHGIGILFGVFFLSLAAYYGLPAVLQRQSAKPDDLPRRGAWGIETASGYLTGRQAWAQMMTVPLLMLLWAVAVAFLH